MTTLGKRLESLGIQCHAVDQRKNWRVRQQWRRTFAAAVKEQTGRWCHLGRDWHAFSYGFSRSLSGERAKQAYMQLSSAEFYVFPEEEGAYGYFCSGISLPHPSEMGGTDLYVFPEDLSWTMVFTHEEPDLGPYFSRDDWIHGAPPEGKR